MAQSYSFRIQAEGLDQFRAQMEAAAKGNDALAQAWQRLLASSPQLATALDRAHAAVDRVTKQTQDAGRGFANFGQVIGQAGFQVQDFAVQVASGQSALIAFAQQGSQLAGVFGPTGAIAGAVIAIGAIVAQLAAGKDAAQALNETVQRQEQLWRAATDAADRYNRGVREQAEEFLRLRDAYAAMNRERRAFELARLEEERGRIGQDAERLRRDVEAMLRGIQRDAAATIRGATDPGIAGVGAARAAIAAIGEWRTTQQVTEEAISRLAGTLRLAGDQGGYFGEVLRELAARFEPLVSRAGDLDKALTQNQRLMAALEGRDLPAVASQTDNAANSLDGAAASAGRLARSLAEVRAAIHAAPLAGLEAMAARAQERLDAVRRGGLSLLETVQSQQEQAERAKQLAEQALEQDVRRLREAQASQAEIDRFIEENRARALDFAMRVVATEAQVAEQRRRIEEAQRQAERRQREAEQAARQREREAEREAEQQRREAERAEREAQRLAEAQRREMERFEEARQRQAERVTDSIVEYTADRFADLFDRNQKGWEGMLETFERTARSLAARLAAELIIRPVVTPIVSGLFGDAGAVSLLGPMLGVRGGLGGGGGGTPVLLGPNGEVLGFAGPVAGGMGGATGAGGGGGLFGGALTYVTGFLNTPIWGGSGTDAMGNAIGVGPTWGQGLAGIGTGFALGSMVGGYVAGNAPARRTNAQVGSGVGAVAGTVIGGIFGGGQGAQLGGMAGGLLGGIFGGLIGPTPHPGGAIILGSTGAGEFGVLDSRSKHMPGFAEFDAQIREQARQINQALNAIGISVDPGQAGAFGYIGAGPAAQGHPGQYQTLQDMILGNVHRLRAANANLQTALRSGGIRSFEDIFETAEWIRNVYEPLTRAGEATSSWAQRIREINETFREAINTAQRLGLETGRLKEVWDQQVEEVRAARQAEISGLIAELEGRRAGAVGDLALGTQARLRAFDAAAEAERFEFERRLRDLDLGAERYERLMAEFAEIQRLERERLQRDMALQRQQAAVSLEQIAAQIGLRRAQAEEDDPASRRAQLRLFDLAARMERLELEARLQSLGADRARIDALVAEMREVQKLERERLRQQLLGQDPASVQRRAQIATAQVTSLVDYARSLTYSPLSPLSPQEQFRQAERQFQAVAGAAAAGDWSSIMQLQSYADAYLQAARGVYGSGTGYVEVFRRVTDALERVGEMAPNQLTDAVYREETRRQTDTLREELTELRQEVRRLRAAVEQGSRAPARIAA